MKTTKINFDIPKEVSSVINKLVENNFEAFLVGGCVRDLFLNKNPTDWDITTNALPEEIEKIFEHTFYENNFGTVGVVNDKIIEKLKKEEAAKLLKKSCFTDVSYETLKSLEIIEVTPYRIESKYSDARHPDEVKFSKKLEDDLKRRDFTINAICYNPVNKEIIDLYGGIADLFKKEIKAIGNPDERFQEDALRMLRALRFTTQLNFIINQETATSIKNNHILLKKISQERIRDEFVKILMTKRPVDAFFLAHKLNILDYISKDFERGIGCEQNGAHIYDVFEHLLRTMQHAADKNWSFEIRLAGLFHDISKPETRRWSKEKNNFTFYGHEVVGARVTEKNLKRLKFDNKIIEKITKLVRNHMFFSDPDMITLSAVRRIIRNVGGAESVWDLIKLRICDRIGMGRPKEQPYRLRKYQALMEEAMRSPISVKDLKINGNEIQKLFHIKQSPKIGLILNALMGVTLFEPENNNKTFLLKHIKKLLELSDTELKELSKKGLSKIKEEETKEVEKLHIKHHVKLKV